MEKVIINNDAGISVRVGAVDEEKIFSLNYVAKRSTNTEVGIITVVNNGSSASAEGEFNGTTCSLSLDAFVTKNSVYLTVTADSSGGNTKFYYEIN